MKILHVIPSINPKLGGPAQGIRNYETGLKKMTFVYRDIVSFDNPEDAKDWITGSLNVFALGEVHNQWYYQPKLKPWLYKYLSNYDVVIIDGLWSYHSSTTINVIDKLRAKGKSVPKVFVMSHGMLDPWFQRAPSRRLKAIRNSIYWHLIEKKVINNADGILFTCQEELELARTTFNDYHPKTELNVGYGIAPPPAYTAAMKTAFEDLYVVNKPYFLFLSRIHPKKGVDLLIKAYKMLLLEKANYAEEIPELVIAGPGLEEAYGEAMKKLVAENEELKKHVHFVGMLTGNAKWGAIYGSEAFVLPSHQENFGIAVAEALACGKPVLISNQVNIWNEINSVKAGLVAEDSVEGTLTLLKSFMNLSVSERTQMQRQALDAYTTFFDVRTTAKNLIEAIR